MSGSILAALLLAVSGVPFVAQASVEQTVIALERSWAQANRTGDTKALDTLLAPDFTMIDEEGRVQTRSAYMAIFATQRLEISTVSDFKVSVHGNSAVVFSIVEGKGADAAGNAIAFRLRVADTWVKMPDGNWQCVASAEVALK